MIRVEGGDIAELTDARINRDVASYLERVQPSCHGDTASELLEAAADRCGEWIAFSPSFRAYGYVALITNRIVFAVGIGQASACFRVAGPVRERALATGAVAAPEIAPEIGHEWVRFELFRNDWPKPDLPFWMLHAYVAAREGAG